MIKPVRLQNRCLHHLAPLREPIHPPLLSAGHRLQARINLRHVRLKMRIRHRLIAAKAKGGPRVETSRIRHRPPRARPIRHRRLRAPPACRQAPRARLPRPQASLTRHRLRPAPRALVPRPDGDLLIRERRASTLLRPMRQLRARRCLPSRRRPKPPGNRNPANGRRDAGGLNALAIRRPLRETRPRR